MIATTLGTKIVIVGACICGILLCFVIGHLLDQYEIGRDIDREDRYDE